MDEKYLSLIREGLEIAITEAAQCIAVEGKTDNLLYWICVMSGYAQVIQAAALDKLVEYQRERRFP